MFYELLCKDSIDIIKKYLKPEKGRFKAVSIMKTRFLMRSFKE